MSKDIVTNEDVTKWLGDDIHDTENLVLIIGDVANGDYDPKTLLNDILETVKQ